MLISKSKNGPKFLKIRGNYPLRTQSFTAFMVPDYKTKFEYFYLANFENSMYSNLCAQNKIRLGVRTHLVSKHHFTFMEINPYEKAVSGPYYRAFYRPHNYNLAS